jgi:hypothetical protein
MPKGMARAGQGNAKGRVPGTGEMVRDYFLTVKSEAFQMEIFRYVKSRCDMGGWSCPSVYAFANYFGRLKKLKLVIPLNPPKEGDDRWEKRYFRINMDLAGSEMWLNPTRYLYG